MSSTVQAAAASMTASNKAIPWMVTTCRTKHGTLVHRRWGMLAEVAADSLLALASREPRDLGNPCQQVTAAFEVARFDEK